MIQILPTQNYAGFELRGDSADLKSLLSAVYYVDNESYLRKFGYNDSMNYFFGFAFEARYALEGRRGIVCMDNNSKLWNYPDNIKLYPEAPEKNLYYAVRLPVVCFLFYVFVSEEILALDRRFREESDGDLSELPEKESAEAVFRLLNSAAYHALDAIIGIRARMLLQERLTYERSKEFYLFRNYVTPYTDFLSETYLSLPKFRRKRLLPAILEDLIGYRKNDLYGKIERNISEYSDMHKIAPGMVKYSGSIDWNKIKW